jgi:sec-independent protein translocase protein TatA
VFRSLEGPVGLILAVIVIAIFAGPKLPSAAKGIAQSIKIFKKEVKSDDKKPEATGSDAAGKGSAQDSNSNSN